MRISLCLLTLTVAGCATPESAPVAPDLPAESPAAPAEAIRAPGAALQEALLAIYGPDDGEVRFFSGQTDLDGNGVDEVVVHVVGPQVCGSGGCTTLVFTPDGAGLRRVGEITVSRPPITAAETRTNGWRDLAVGTGGGGGRAGQALLPFDGAAYASNPTVAPARALDEAVPGTVLIEPFESFTDGEVLRAGTP